MTNSKLDWSRLGQAKKDLTWKSISTFLTLIIGLDFLNFDLGTWHDLELLLNLRFESRVMRGLRDIRGHNDTWATSGQVYMSGMRVSGMEWGYPRSLHVRDEGIPVGMRVSRMRWGYPGWDEGIPVVMTIESGKSKSLIFWTLSFGLDLTLDLNFRLTIFSLLVTLIIRFDGKMPADKFS